MHSAIDHFCGAGCHIRDGNNTRTYCGDGNPGCYGQVHADGEVIMGAMWKVRERMRAELQRGGSDQFDLKQGAGGIADIEFMVQYAVLRWAHEYPDLLEFSDNIRLLDGLERHRLLAAEEAGSLRDAYRAFRASYHRNALQELPGLVAGRRHADERARVRELWQRLMHAPAG